MSEVERVQTGIRMEKRLLKVLKGLAEDLDLSFADLIEGIALHVIEGKLPFSSHTVQQAERLREVYGLTLRAADSHSLSEKRLEQPEE